MTKKHRRKAKTDAPSVKVDGRPAFVLREAWRVRYGVRAALRDPRFYLRRDMIAEGSE